jgi:hypothetical protein
MDATPRPTSKADKKSHLIQQKVRYDADDLVLSAVASGFGTLGDKARVTGIIISALEHSRGKNHGSSHDESDDERQCRPFFVEQEENV